MQTAIQLAAAIGVEGLISRSAWRRRRLLILCYHGFSQCDEHRWNPSLYIPGGTFERRLQLLREAGASLLPLAEAVARLQAGTLPPRAVALTVDDGAYDFLAVAQPILRRHQVPVTLYCSTWYMQHPWPVFDVVLRYLLWRGVENSVGSIELEGLMPRSPLANPEAAEELAGVIRVAMSARGASGREKQELLEQLAPLVGEDLNRLMAKRLFSLLRLEELALLDPSLVDVQLHTHRHRTADNREDFLAEIEENRAALAAGNVPRAGLSHFCYPSGRYEARFLPWLKEAGVSSATTCDPALGGPASHPLLLPRFVDTATTSEVEFTAWVSGLRHLLRRRPA